MAMEASLRQWEAYFEARVDAFGTPEYERLIAPHAENTCPLCVVLPDRIFCYIDVQIELAKIRRVKQMGLQADMRDRLVPLK